MSKLILSAGLTLVLASTAAAAAPSGKSANTSDSEKKYCIRFDGTTGSRVPKTECHTKAEWARLGIDIGAKSGD